jgi:glycosyltransferase involved in cell wall biosynthesis
VTRSQRTLPPDPRPGLHHGATLRYVAEDAPTGYGDAADRLVRALRANGERIEYRGWSATAVGAPPSLLPFSRDELPGERAVPGAPTVAHLVPEYYPLVQETAPAGPFVAHTVWESDRLPHHWPDLLNATDLVIVPTEWNREVFVAGGVRVPVTVVPHVVTEPDPGDHGEGLAIADDLVVFYTIGRWDERKAVFRTVRAFLDAFTADDPVTLVVKTGMTIEMPPSEWGAQSRLAYTTAWQLASIVREYRSPARVQLEVDKWSQARVDGLHHRGDCYLTLARGEGWGLGVFDATAFGNPVIATGWGGFVEYLTANDAYLVDHRVVPVHSSAFASYSPDQHWAEADTEHAVELLRTVAADPDAARAHARPAQQRVLRDYAGPVVAARFVDALEELANAAGSGARQSAS